MIVKHFFLKMTLVLQKQCFESAFKINSFKQEIFRVTDKQLFSLNRKSLEHLTMLPLERFTYFLWIYGSSVEC